jgi:hypothetical protein
MKASKIRIVVILLLIIFFGLLILFGSRNIYEGARSVSVQAPATTAATSGDSSIYTSNTLDFSRDLGYITTLSTGMSKYSPSSNEYFIKVYFFVPKTGSKTLKLSDIPIGFINHNLPSEYNLYFNNMNNTTSFGGNISPSTLQTSIYIEKSGKPDTDTNSVIDYAKVDYAIKTDKITSLKTCKDNGNNSWTLTTTTNNGKTPLVYATRKTGTKILDSHYVVKVPSNSPSPFKHEYKQISSLKPVSAMTSFPIAYGSIKLTNLIPYDGKDISKDVGLINLVNVYVKLK